MTTERQRLERRLAHEEAWLAGDWDSRSSRGIATMYRHRDKRDALRTQIAATADLTRPEVVAIDGQRALHEPPYGPADWQERDNFPTLDHAREYARLKARMYNATPYRIVHRDDRFAVEFVPAWLLAGSPFERRP